ncbi:MAG: endonuclease/exonuclease/phosphatase family protein [Firmicutes bacterium]|nr:endonuclease/exonuclease/phosphatase family protein [Bacillota bacterium]
MQFLSNALFLVMSMFMSLACAGPWAAFKTPEPPAPPAARDTMKQQITVMSFNLKMTKTGSKGLPKRLNGVVQTILKEKPDSFGLQEAHADWRAALLRELGDTYAIACARGRSTEDAEGAPVFYRKDKYGLVKEETFWISPWPDRVSYGFGASFPRVAGYAVLKDKKTGFTYAHFNAHFDHLSGTARTNGAWMVAQGVNELGLPAVFTADMNAQPGTQPAQYLEAGGMTDLRKAAKATDEGVTFHNYGDKLVGGTVLDYIYANGYLRGAKEFKVIRDEYDGMYPSDHFAVCATLTLAN